MKNQHPEKWYIVATKENITELNRWRLSVRTESAARHDSRFISGCYLLSKHPVDGEGSYFYVKTTVPFPSKFPEYQEITLDQFRQITNSNKMKHPEKWYIVATKENFNELNAWRKTIARPFYNYNDFEIDNPLLSKHPSDDSYYYGGFVDRFKSDPDYKDYQEITLEQFRQITNSKPVPETTAIQISRNLLNEYYEASTTPQKEYLSEHFKLNGWTTVEAIRGLYDLACSGWKPKIKANHPDCFEPESKEFNFRKYVESNSKFILKAGAGEGLGLSDDFIQVRVDRCSDYYHKGFYLDSKYNWELVTDKENAIVLVPTKKIK